MDIDSVADELYSLPPERFTAARGVSEKAAKATGDDQLAAEIRQLRKPSTGAWLANQLVREHSDEVLAFLDLGSAFREATTLLSGDQLRELGRQRRQLVYALMQQVRRLAGAAGHKVSQDTSRALEDTLHAALADDGVADQLRAGRLTETLQGAGFSPATSNRQADKLGPGNRAPDQLGSAEREEQEAQAAVRDAAALQTQAQDVADRTETDLQKVAGLVSELRAKLDKARIEQRRLEEEYRQSQADLDSAIRAVRGAAQRLDQATRRRKQRSR